ncbi:hypothetical protein Bbelb_049910 [Branchiostoma belcheri]|nr:hypothetical protein Bbelb_049910 [Branchiostoma belcheri]
MYEEIDPDENPLEYEETEDTTEMRSKLKGLERTCRMTVWEDSSEINGQAYSVVVTTRARAVPMQNDLMTLSMFISVDGGGKRRTKKHHRERGKGKGKGKVEALLPANLTHSLKWNSFINTAGGKWGNMPLDLRLEQNTLLKAFLKHLGTNLNETNAAELQIVLELIRSVPASLATVLKDMPRQTESLTWNTGEKFSGLRVMSSRHCAGDGERGIVGVVLTPFKHHPGSFGEMRNIPKILEEHLGLKEVAGKLLQLEARESALRTEEESGLWTGVNQDLMSNDEKVESNGSEAGLI